MADQRMLALQKEYARRTRDGDVEGLAALFTPDAVIRHSYDERTIPAAKAVRLLGEVHRARPGVCWEDVSVLPTPHGFVWQAVIIGSAPRGEVRAHTCSVATVRASRLLERLDEYLDPAAIAPLTAVKPAPVRGTAAQRNVGENGGEAQKWPRA